MRIIAVSMDPSIASSGNNIYANVSGNSEIFFFNSTDGGKTFSTIPKNISNNEEGSSFPTIDIS